ncbi:MAG: FGGY-family carbohydrate kinase [Cyanobacteria bacterium P01_F01_bin.42]
MSSFVGIDFGTSGARLMVIDARKHIRFETAIAFASEDATSPKVWRDSLFNLLGAIPPRLKTTVERIAIDGTSATVMICDPDGSPLAPPQMYCDRGRPEVLEQLGQIAPSNHIVLSLSSSLCKYLSWASDKFFEQAHLLLHQADWLAAQLHGQWGVSDYHNSLKLGFDPLRLQYPDWFSQILDCSKLPKPLKPGARVNTVRQWVAKELDLPTTAEICAGTTDSIAAFLASGACRIGDAVTSLGSTIALKLLSERRVDSLVHGVYSHWFGKDRWLVGGASNAGGAVLSQLFAPAELEELSREVNWSRPVAHSYVPLTKTGERFPINDSNLEPCLEPRPDSSAEFLQGILTSLTQVEFTGYECLVELGASPIQQIFTAGGGTRNLGWMEWRKTQANVPVVLSEQPEAAYGAALLALQPLM